MADRLRRLLRFCRKQVRDRLHLLRLRLKILQRTVTTEHGETHAALVIHQGKHFDHADLSRVIHVCATAGTDIRPRNLYDADLTGQLFLDAVFDRFQFLLIRICHLYRKIRPDNRICLLLDFL